jgi:hypothetical protein
LKKWIVSFFEESGDPALGLSPIINIRDVSDGSLVITGGAMIEKGDGSYAYDFVGYDDTKDYVVRSDSVTLSGTDRYSYGSTGEYNESLNEIKSTVDDIDIRTLLIRKIQTNKLELADGDTGNWVLYDDPPNETVPLLTFNVTDKNGDLIVQPANIPSKRSKGY